MPPIDVSEVNDGKHVCQQCPIYRDVDYVTSSAQQMAEHLLDHDFRGDTIPPEIYEAYSPMFPQ